MPSEGEYRRTLTKLAILYSPASSYVKEVDGLTSTIRKTYSAGRKQLLYKSFNEAAQHPRSVAEGGRNAVGRVEEV